ncbi:hypothetical protein BHM03_00015846 [Ensete ventricosum]|uniref:Uncharacterized protein n=1 Tax=Ensete ventricosum TaxID=4639 RepID=A0A445MEK8_ENSVE|nr:hypothetical protein BHM03_00015846 [Ensete ventricosum]
MSIARRRGTATVRLAIVVNVDSEEARDSGGRRQPTIVSGCRFGDGGPFLLEQDRRDSEIGSCRFLVYVGNKSGYNLELPTSYLFWTLVYTSRGER